jgi:hypothetical protein
MAKQSRKSRQAAGLRRASHKRGVSIQQRQRMNDRADKLLREAARDRERLVRMQANQSKF